MLDAGAIDISETCPWNRFQERFISSYRYSTGRKVT